MIGSSGEPLLYYNPLYFFPMGRGYSTGSGDWLREDSQELQINCQAHGVSYNDDLDLTLYFCTEELYEKVKLDLKEGSNWMVSGHFSITNDYMTIFDPEYRPLNAEERTLLL